MDPNVLNSQGISFDVRKWTIDAYRRVLENNMIWRGFCKLIFLFTGVYHYFSSGNSAGSISNVQERICGKKFLQCYFSHYHVFRWRNDPDFYPDQSATSGKYNLGNPKLPGAFNVWNMILARTYYQSIPKELREASAIDGATEIEHFFQDYDAGMQNRSSQCLHCGPL